MKRRSIFGAAVAMVASLALAGSVLAVGAFQNGSFDQGAWNGASGYENLVTGSTAIPGWTVTAGNIDWIQGFWTSYDGARSLDLSGSSAGAISQTFATTAGATYFVSFWLAGNPNAGPPVKTMTVSTDATGSPLTTYLFDTIGHTTDSMGWVQQGYSFTASSASTTLTFTSLTDTNAGPALDKVSVTKLGAATGANCKNGGWATMYDSSGAPFKNQGACVSYFATSGQTPIGRAAPATSHVAPLYNVTTTPGAWDCALGATNTTGGTNGTVTWTAMSGTVTVMVSVVGGLPNATYDAWVEQNPGTCPYGTSSPSNPGAVTTDASGNGSATFFFTPMSSATNFWLSLWAPAGSQTGTSVLRSTAVVLY